jgi:exopolysaccharide biosynthesis polyprenyl glycosylphosphotransferase
MAIVPTPEVVEPGTRAASPSRTSGPRLFDPTVDSPSGTHTPFPIVLQRRAAATLRRHLGRGMVRFWVLVATDLASVWTMRALFRASRDGSLLGPQVATMLQNAIPKGTLRAGEIVLAVFLGLILMGCYGIGDQRRHAGALAAGAAAGLLMVFWSRLWDEAGLWALTGFLLTAAGFAMALFLGRQLLELGIDWVRPHAGFRSRVVLVGRHAEVRDAREAHALGGHGDFEIAGFLDIESPAHPAAMGSVAALVDTIEREKIETVILCGHLEDTPFARIVDVVDAAGCRLMTFPRAYRLGGVEPRLIFRNEAPLVELTRPAIRGGQLVVKRALDLTASGFGLLLLAPVFLAIGALVKLTSPGPVLFRQARVGRGGELFSILKFRSMRADAESLREQLESRSVYTDARLFKVQGDPRITPLGRFLRKTSLDELPQLWNVFTGQMSLVGPRPPIPSEVALYEEHHYSRFDVKPGMTGPWQVNGRNRITDFEDVVRLERSYIRNWTLWKDFAILLRTVPVVLKMDGAH